MRLVLRITGLILVLGAGYFFWESLRQLDRREYVSGALALMAGWLITQAGVEFVRPESAE